MDAEHAIVYFQVAYRMLREPLRAAMEKLVMERQIRNEEDLPPVCRHFWQRGEAKGRLEGGLEGRREALVRLTGERAAP